MRIALILFLLGAATLHAQNASTWEEVRALVRHADKIPSEDGQRPVLERAYNLATEAIKKNPTSSMDYLWHANAAGRLGQISSGMEKIELAKMVKTSAERSIQLNPGNGEAHMTLGAWHYYVADLTWFERQLARVVFGKLPESSYQLAVYHLAKAVELGGVDNLCETYYILGRSYEEIDNDRLAQQSYRSSIAAHPRDQKEAGFQRDAKK